MSDDLHTPLFRTRGGVALLVFLATAGFYLATEHTAHLLGALPFLLFIACPLMHLFMHHGHHRHNHGSESSARRTDGHPGGSS